MGGGTCFLLRLGYIESSGDHPAAIMSSHVHKFLLTYVQSTYRSSEMNPPENEYSKCKAFPQRYLCYPRGLMRKPSSKRLSNWALNEEHASTRPDGGSL
ncbi:hypothetical protein CDAR_35351 [Caerostris darwini]|uniref:Uncharacterized protein n=1 Tax=Caerostris darwini TaxID=1538125 RepID=A0AAV4SN24_9ARAC|nr:hypothetical protein CDAR_35351 [Caerostris darwini]